MGDAILEDLLYNLFPGQYNFTCPRYVKRKRHKGDALALVLSFLADSDPIPFSKHKDGRLGFAAGT